MYEQVNLIFINQHNAPLCHQLLYYICSSIGTSGSVCDLRLIYAQ